MDTFQLPPHVEALRCMMVEGGGDGRVMPPELVGEVMGYCGSPMLRMDGPSEEMPTMMNPLDLDYAFIDDGEMYHVQCSNGTIDIIRSHTGALACICWSSRYISEVDVHECCYDAENRRLFISYSHGQGRIMHHGLVGYSFSDKRVFLEVDLDTLSNRHVQCCSLSAAGDFLYIACMRSGVIDVYYIQWSKSKEVKLAYSVATAKGPLRVFLRALPTAPSSVNVLYQYVSERPSETVLVRKCRQVKLRIVRSEPFIKFEAIQNMTTEAEEIDGDPTPLLGSKPPMYFFQPTEGGTCCLRSADDLRKLAEFDLGGGELPACRIIVDGRWTLGYFRAVDGEDNVFGTYHLVRFHPYVNE
ncbi:hypothetical protein FOZ61_009067 [Perkinsus olseni]|uniref:Uncharacterized protein n=1 Tax=Perkinsus olseni TaxID=32597 RepID=A0A7J6L2D1_PEROL|nr:hypothetical protein FOZ61_009067 [Perkinsus olseni]KAF4655639.1 hypothetical protein FOL46_008179 [Perkinsus olseni]